MSIQFDGTNIKCGDAHSALYLTGGEVQRKERYFWGLQGVSEVIATTGAWDLTCTCWLNDDDFKDTTGIGVGLIALRDYLQTLRGMRGNHASVVQFLELEPGTIVSNSWAFATFLGFEATPFDGQNHTPSPIFDDAGGVNGGWILQGQLRWRLLRDDE